MAKSKPELLISKINDTGVKFICWSSNDKTSHSKVYVVCKNKLHVNLVKVTNIIHARQGSCFKCGRAATKEMKRARRENKVREDLAVRNLHLMSFVHDDTCHRNSELVIKCSMGHVYETTLGSSSHNGCSVCSGNQKYSKNIPLIKEKISRNNILLLTKLDDTLRAGSILKLIFPCGHLVTRKASIASSYTKPPLCQACVDANRVGYYTLNNIRGTDKETEIVSLYVLKLRDTSSSFWKVGISSNIKHRVSCLKSEKIQVLNIKHVELPLIDAIEIEQDVLVSLAEYYYFSSEMRSGKHECISVDPTNKVMEKLSQKGIYEWQM